MERYLGLDVHAASSTLVVLSQSGKQLRQSVIETNGQALVEAIRAIAGRKLLCFEEGTQSAWLYEILSPHVQETVVAMPGRSPGQKNDALDAHGLAEKLRSGQIERPVFKAPGQFSLLRERARMHNTIARDLVRVQARLKSQYRARGIRTPGASVYGHRRREAWLHQLPRAARSSAERLYAQLDFLVGLKQEAEQDLIQESKRHRITRILETIPGLGPIRVARLVPIVVTPYRFRTRQQFWSYCGLGIVTRTSSDWVRTPDRRWVRTEVQRTRGLGRRHNHVLKDIFKGAAMSVLVHYPDDPLYRHYQRQLEGGTKPTLARVTLARKLASTLLAQWKKEEPYQPQRDTGVQSRELGR
jgi:transposase